MAKVNPALVLPDKEGKPYTVRYDAVNAMLLNEFLKEHRRVEELKSADGAAAEGFRGGHRSATENNGSARGALERAGSTDSEGQRSG